MAMLTGRLEVTAVCASALPNVRMLSSMSPMLTVELGGARRSTPEARGEGKNPKWDYCLGTWDLRGVRDDAILDASIADGATPVARAQMQLARVLSLAADAAALVGGDGSFSVALTCAKDLSKQQGELILRCKWTPQPQPQPQQPPLMQMQPQHQQPPMQPPVQMQQPAPQQQHPPPMHRAHTVAMLPHQQQVQQPQMVMQSQQYQQHQQSMQMAPQMPIMSPTAPHVYVQQQQPLQQQSPPSYYPPQHPQPQHQPDHSQMVMHHPQASPVMYAQPYPQGTYAAPPGYAPEPQQQYCVAQQPGSVMMPSPPAPVQQGATYYAAPPAMSAPVLLQHMSPAPIPPQQQQQWIPVESSADGVFPFSELTITRQIGDGTFGTVSAGEWRGTPVAVKTLKQHVFSRQQWEEFMSEVKFLREARHPNVVLFMGVTFNPYSIVTELLDTSLFAVLHQQRRVLTAQQQVHIALGVARGLASLHGHAVPIVHRDIKSLNILVSNDLISVKICDLGMVKLKAAQGTRLEANGTPLWMAPEVLLDLPYDEQADVFSFGSLLYEIVTSTVPFGGGNIPKEELVRRVGRQGERPPLPPMNQHFRDLIVKCWQQHPQARPNMKQIVNTLAAIRF